MLNFRMAVLLGKEEYLRFLNSGWDFIQILLVAKMFYWKLQINGMSLPPEANRAIPEIEKFADIGEYFDKPVNIYSSGMMARLAFSSIYQIVLKYL